MALRHPPPSDSTTIPSRKLPGFIFLLCLALALFIAFALGTIVGLVVATSRAQIRRISTAAMEAASCSPMDLPKKVPRSSSCPSGTSIAASRNNLTLNHADSALFRLAVAVKPAPPNSTHKIAFLFLTRGPLPLAPLWERFFRGHERRFSIYIHTAPDFIYNETKIPPVFRNRQIPSQRVRWGDVTLVDAERRLLANALLDPHNQRFLLVSESCVPLHDFKTLYNYVMHSNHVFTQIFDDKGKHGRGRWRSGFLPEVPKAMWRKGSQWFDMDRSLALITVNDTKYYPKFKQHCWHACYVDEHYMPTMFYILAAERMANRTLTWVDWSRSRGYHPATYRWRDVNMELLDKMRRKKNCKWNGENVNTCYLIARKFGPGTLKALLRHAKLVFGY